MYAASLLHTDNIKALTLYTSTVEHYLLVATKVLCSTTLSKRLKYFDPHYNHFSVKLLDLEQVIPKHKHWEDMPHRCEPLTLPMILYMETHCSKNLNSLKSAHFNWQVLGHYISLQKGKWCPDAVIIKHSTFICTHHTPHHGGHSRQHNISWDK